MLFRSKRIEVLGVIRFRNKAANKDVLLFVVSIGRKVEKHPYVDSAHRSFSGIKLSTVY